MSLRQAAAPGGDRAAAAGLKKLQPILPRLSDLITVDTSGPTFRVIEDYYAIRGHLATDALTWGERVILEAEQARAYAELLCREFDLSVRPARRPTSRPARPRVRVVLQ